MPARKVRRAFALVAGVLLVGSLSSSRRVASALSDPPVGATVRADAPALLAEPFVIWSGEADIAPLTSREIAGLQRFLALGGVMFVDDADPEVGAFGKAAKRELTRVVPDGAPVQHPTGRRGYGAH